MSELKTYKMVDEKYCTDCVCVIPSEVYLKSEVDAVITEIKQKLEDAGMRERKLKRALYKACANWAHHRVFVRYKINEKAWENVERKCRAKAEEYK